MVVEKNKNNLILPVALGLVLFFAYYYLGVKAFVAGFGLLLGVMISTVDIRYGLYGATLIMPFLPNSLALAVFLGLGVFFFLYQVLKGTIPLYTGGLITMVLIYLVMMIIQTVTSIYPVLSIRDLGLHMAGILYLIVIVNTIKTKEDLYTFLVVLMTGAVIVSIIGLIQAVVGVEIQEEWVDTSNNIGLTTRVYSVFGNPNILAEYLVFMIPVGVGLFWFTTNLSQKVFYGLGLVIMFVTLGLTMSRGGWLGIAMAALVFVLLVDRRLLLMAIPMVLVGLMVLPQSIINRLVSIGNLSDSSNDYRLKIWSITGEIIKDYPVAGLGLGHQPFMEVFNTYIRTMPIYHAHNTVLQMIVELGFVGFGIFIMFMYTFMTRSIGRLIIDNDDKYTKYIGAGVLAAIAGVFTHGMVEVLLYLPKIIFMFWTMMAVLIVLSNIKGEEI